MAKNKLQKFEEMDQFPHVIQADFDEVFKSDYRLKGKWKEKFFDNENPLVLELGCGKGEYCVGLARKFPNKNFIGIDIKGSRMHNGASQSFNEGLKNVAFIRTRIELIESFFNADEVSEIWLTFPDPQMKRTKKRLTSTRFLAMYLKFLKPGGVIHLKTDSRFLYTYTSHLVTENNFTVLQNFEDLYNSDFKDEILKIRTYYEERFMAHQIPIKYLSFIPNYTKSLVEPLAEIELDNYHNSGRNVQLIKTKSGGEQDFRK